LYFIIQLDPKKYLSKQNYRFFFQKGVVLSGFAPNILGPLGIKHLNIVVLFQRAKKFGGCFEFKVLKVELNPNAR
jgi:hypothetical protein